MQGKAGSSAWSNVAIGLQQQCVLMDLLEAADITKHVLQLGMWASHSLHLFQGPAKATHKSELNDA